MKLKQSTIANYADLWQSGNTSRWWKTVKYILGRDNSQSYPR